MTPSAATLDELILNLRHTTTNSHAISVLDSALREIRSLRDQLLIANRCRRTLQIYERCGIARDWPGYLIARKLAGADTTWDSQPT